MNDQARTRNPNGQRFVQDFDALGDLMQRIVDWDLGGMPQEAVPAAEMEFTTEWQMEPSTEMANTH